MKLKPFFKRLAGVTIRMTGPVCCVATLLTSTAIKAETATLTVTTEPPVPGSVVGWGDNRWGQIDIPSGLSNVVALAGGELHSLALCRDGTVVSWGAGAATGGGGRCAVPASLSNVVAIAAGAYHNLALKADGTVVEWAHNSEFPTLLPPGLTNVVAIDAGGYHNLALKEGGTVAAWGANDAGQSNVPWDLTNVIAIAAGHGYSLALRGDGKVVGWGQDYWSGHPTCVDLPEAAVLSAYWHTVALLADRTVVNWVSDYHFQSNVPPDLLNVQAIAAGGEHGLAIRDDWTVTAWASWNAYGSTIVPAGLTGVTAVAGGDWHSLALVGEGPPFLTVQPLSRAANRGRATIFYGWATGEAPLRYQWQFNGEDIPGATNALLALYDLQPGAAGIYRAVVSNAQGAVVTRAAALNLVEVAPFITLQPGDQDKPLGAEARFRVAADGSGPLQYQWRFGDADIPGATQPELVLADLTLAQQGWYSAAIRNPFGAVTSAPVFLAVRQIVVWGEATKPPLDLTNAVAFAGGWAHALALKTDGTVAAWGINNVGQCDVPAGLSNVVAIAAGGRHNLALRRDGTVVAWGGDDPSLGEFAASLSHVVAVAAGDHVSLALRADGTIAAWGGSACDLTNVPPPATNIIAIEAGENHCLALRADHTVIGWGCNEYGQATPPSGLNHVIALATSSATSLALKDDGTVVVWGAEGWSGCEEADLPPGLTNMMAIAGGGFHYVALKGDGTVIPWGYDEFGATAAQPDLRHAVAVSGGGLFNMALIGATAPFITAQPVSRNVGFGNDATLYAQATGVWPLSYQWQRNGVPIPGATNATLAIASVELSDAGNYSVAVSNAAGFTVSSNAVLTVLPRRTELGAVDLSYGPVLAGWASRLAMQPDGRLLLFGDFTGVNGVAQTNLARLNLDGSLDPGFRSEAVVGLSHNASVVLQSDGRLVIAGAVTDPPTGQLITHKFFRLQADGSLDSTFAPAVESGRFPSLLALQSGDRLIAVHYFQGGSLLCRYQVHGELDLSFQTINLSGAIHLVAVQPDDRILLVGDFGGQPRVVRLNADGSLDTSFQVTLDYRPYAIAVQPNGKILLGGYFGQVNGTAIYNLARLHANGALDMEFTPAITGTVFCLVVQPNGQIVMGGNFWEVNGVPRNCIARLQRDGTLDQTFDPGTGPYLNSEEQYVWSIVLQPDGRIMVNGDFCSFDGVPRADFVRLYGNPDNAPGALDLSFDLTAGGALPGFEGPSHFFYPGLNTVALQPDGRVVVGGNFTRVNGVARPELARFHPNGALDLSFAPPVDLDYRVYALAVQSDGKVLMGGYRTVHNDRPTLGQGIARLNADGSCDSSFDVGPGVGGSLECITLQPDGKILIGGQFNSFNGVVRNGIARLNPNGTLDTGFVPPTVEVQCDNPDDGVNAIVLQPDGKILVGGGFLDPNRQGPGLMRLNTDGSLDDSFHTPLEFSSPVFALALQPDGKILVGGYLFWDDQAYFGMIRLNSNGTRDDSFTVFDGSIRALAVLPDGRILVGGNFDLTLLLPDGTLDPTFQSGPRSVESIALQPDGQILVGGKFTELQGFPILGLARLNAPTPIAPTLDPLPANLTRFIGQTVSLHASVHGSPPFRYQWYFESSAISSATNAELMIANIEPAKAGRYWITASNNGGSVTSSVATLTVLPAYTGLGSLDHTFDLSEGGTKVSLGGVASEHSYHMSIEVNTIVVQPDGKMVLGGDFVAVNGVPRMNLARLNADGSLDSAFDTAWGADYKVNGLALQPDGKILVVGEFTMINAVPCRGFARLNPDASVDTSFNPTFDFNTYWPGVRQVLVQPDGKLLVRGSFTNVNGAPRFGLARLHPDGSLDPSFDAGDLGNGPGKYIGQMTPQPDGRLLVCGEFTTTDDRMVRLNADGTLDASFDLAMLDPWHPLHPYSVAVAPDGKILIGEGYEDGIYRLNPDGSLDDTFQPPSMILGHVLNIAVQPDGKILLGGDFHSVAQVPRQGVARLNDDGTLDMSFDPGDATMPPFTMYDLPKTRSLVLLTNGQVLVGAAGPSPYVFFRLQPDGPRDTEFRVSFNPGHAFVNQIDLLPDGKTLLNGYFEMVNGAAYTNNARLNADGTADTSFAPGLLAEPDARLATILRDGRWLVSGVFTNLPGGPRSLARLNLDGSVDASFAPLAGHFYEYPVAVGAMEQPDGKLLIYGPFESVNGVARHYLARLNADGSLDDGFVPAYLEIGDDWYITGVGVQRDGKIVVAGHIFDQPWSTYYGLARLNPDGSEDREFRARVRVEGPVFRLILQPDDKILFSGEFDVVNGHPAHSLARLNADGSYDTSFQSPVPTGTGVPLGPVVALAPDGKIFISSMNVLWRLNPDGQRDPSWHCDFAGGLVYWIGVSALAVEPDGDVIVSGNFQSVNGVPAYGVVRLKGDVTPMPPLVNLPITQQTRLAGQPVTLTVDAAGLGPMTYQWLLNGAPIADATNSSFVIRHSSSAHAGNYSVFVANSVGAVTSAVQQVTVIPVPNTPGSVDVSFDPTRGGQLIGLSGHEVSVNAIARLDDGRWLVGGSFVGINGRPRLYLARLHPNGGVDESFDTSLGSDGPVTRITLQPDGKILIVGAFNRIQTVARPQIARLNANATLDPTFAPDVEGSIQAIAIQADGRVLIGGDFTRVNGLSRMNLARLNPDGSLDTTFDPGLMLESSSAAVSDIKVQPDGRILLAGWFYPFDPLRYVVRLHADGTLDPSFQANVNGWGWWCGATTLALLPDGKMYVSGGQIARLNSDGSLDPSFNADPSAEWIHHGYWIKTITVQSDGKVVLGGAFDSVQGAAAHCLARLNPDGSLDTSFYPSPELPLLSIINAVEATPSGEMLMGGLLHHDANAESCLRLLSPGGWVLNQFETRPYGGWATVEQIALTASNQVVIAGEFASLNGVSRPGLARVNADGTLDHGFIPPPTNGEIKCLAVQSDGRVVAGHYRDDNSMVSGWLSRYGPDGTREENYAAQITGKIYSLLALPDGKLLVGGWFHLPDGRHHCVRLNPDGTVDESFFAEGIWASDDYGVAAIVVQPDGKVLLGGELFNESMGTQGLLRLNPDGSPDAPFNERVQIEGYPQIILLQSDGKILVPSGSTVLRLNPDGTADASFHPPAEGFRPMALQANGKLLGYDGLNIQRLHPDGSVDTAFSAFVYHSCSVYVMAMQADGQILVGGRFSSINGIPFAALTRLNGDPLSTVLVGRALPNVYLPRDPFTVELNATPNTNVVAYAVEDQPPAGWAVTNVSHGGVFDAQSGKVKFGPFFDHEPRTLSYQVLTPARGSHCALGVFCFNGQASADGTKSPIVGQQCLVLAGYFPADVNPPNRRISIEEVTAYGTAWRRGSNWLCHAQGIPINYVTRAAALWRLGECYAVDSLITNEPLWWVPCRIGVPPGSGIALQPPAEKGQAGSLSYAERRAPPFFIPGEPLTVTIAVSPATNASAFAVEDQVPPDWTVTSISDGGELDVVSGKVKWGPFFESDPRALSYQTVAPASSRTNCALAGVASFDGAGIAIVGEDRLRPGCRLVVGHSTPPGEFHITLHGILGARFQIERSTDLMTWLPVAVMTNTQRCLEFTDPAAFAHPQRFYRARLIE